ncbi:MAG: hypothetical protein C4294_00495, partial [Nitrospiraceae bacterium]
MSRSTEYKYGVWPVVVSLSLALMMSAGLGWKADARELMAPKEQDITEIDPMKAPSFDQQKRGIPQSIFVWIHMAKG